MLLRKAIVVHIRQKTGRDGERLAADHLRRAGYQILTLNYTVHRAGEIDLVCRRGDTLACVEVKTRNSLTVPFEYLVPRSKQRKIIYAARHFVQRHGLFDVVVRFDVVFVDLSGATPCITYIPNAFQA